MTEFGPLVSSPCCFCMGPVVLALFQVLYFSESLVPTARKALCDPLEEVREAAAKTFEQLHSTIGHQALEDILPFLLKQLVSGLYCLWNSEAQGRLPRQQEFGLCRGVGATKSAVTLCLSLDSKEMWRQGGK